MIKITEKLNVEQKQNEFLFRSDCIRTARHASSILDTLYNSEMEENKFVHNFYNVRNIK